MSSCINSSFAAGTNRIIEGSYLGRVDYVQALNLQNELVQKSQNLNQDFILGLEHPAVITLGRRATESEIFSPDIPVVSINRGGLATLHSEGQLMIYPIINVRECQIGVRHFVLHLLQSTQKTFSDLGVETFIDDQQIGLYTSRGKIAFCGIEIKSGVSLHGLSINIQNDLSLFRKIRSCGIQEMPLDKLKNYREDISLSEFFKTWMQNFKN